MAATSASATDFDSMSKQQMAEKLLSYQQFMAKYIIDAQEAKTKAVRAAELAMQSKYEEKVMLLGAAPAPAPSGNKLFDDRNAKVAAAGKVGKSRWGDMEVAKATKHSPPAASTPVPAPVPAPVPVPPEVAAADHGLRSDGGVGGPSLAERVNLGAQLLGEVAGAADAPSMTQNEAPGKSLYDQRNARIAAAGKAGKSRWGDMEVAKAMKHAPAAPVQVPVAPEVAAADHGLRNDGGVGGPSLAQRVNLGAAILSN